MGFSDAIRKAKGLIFEMPPESEDKSTQLLDGTGTPTLDLRGDDLDVNELLAEQGIGTRRPFSSTSPSTKTVEEIVREADGPNLDEIKLDNVPVNVEDAAANEPIDLATIYQAAKLPPAPFTAEQMLDMLNSLPQELPLETRRQTVKVTLSALGKTAGATPETIVADASRKMAALAAYSEHLSKRTEEFSKKTEAEIEALQAQIEEKRKAVLNARHQVTKTNQTCHAESERLDDVLEFFSLDVPPSKYAGDAANTTPSAQPNAPTPPSTNPPRK